MMKNTVFDVGMNNGDDTSFYLRHGYRVVAVEASPDLAKSAERKFKRHIDRGDLVIENVGIADQEGSLDFWLCDRGDVWNSFDRDKAASVGSASRSIQVPTTTLDRLIDTHGEPIYCKIDIEGYDRHAVDSLTNVTPPKYLSIEFSHKTAMDDLVAVRDLGYTGFKLIEQWNFSECNLETLDKYSRPPHPLLKNRVKAKRAANKLARKINVGLPFYASGSSGPFGDMLTGPWVPFDHARALAERLIEFDRQGGWGGMSWWFDIHAVR